MNIKEGLREREKDLGKIFSEWNKYEKVKFILDYDIDELQSDMTDLITKLNEKVDGIKENSSILESNPKLERYVSFSELLNYMRNNYLENVWYNGIDLLRKIIDIVPSEVLDRDSRKYYKWYRIRLDKKLDQIEGYIIYSWDGRYDDRLWEKYNFNITQKNGVCCFVDEVGSLDNMKLISDKIDFSNLYNYYMTNEVAHTVYKLEAKYDWNGEILTVPIELGNYYIDISDIVLYYIDISTLKQEGYPRKSEDKMNIRLRTLYATDPQFLDNLKVRYEDLPTYVQDKILNSNYNGQGENLKNEQSKKVKSWIKKLFPNFTK